MRKILFILALLLTGVVSAQKMGVDVIKFQGNVTTTIRDTFDVPTGEYWMIYNTTTLQLETSDDTDVWAALDAGTDDQTAAEVTNTASGNLTSTNVQASLEELQTDVDGRVDLTTTQNIGGEKNFTASQIDFNEGARFGVTNNNATVEFNNGQLALTPDLAIANDVNEAEWGVDGSNLWYFSKNVADAIYGKMDFTALTADETLVFTDTDVTWNGTSLTSGGGADNSLSEADQSISVADRTINLSGVSSVLNIDNGSGTDITRFTKTGLEVTSIENIGALTDPMTFGSPYQIYNNGTGGTTTVTNPLEGTVLWDGPTEEFRLYHDSAWKVLFDNNIIKSKTAGLPGGDQVLNIVSGTESEISGWATDANRLDICTDCKEVYVWEVPITGQGDDIAVATSVNSFFTTRAVTVTNVYASLSTAPTGSVATFDINEDGTSILSTKITIDATEKTSNTAATAPVISDSAIASFAELTFDIDGVGSTIAGATGTIYIHYTVD